MTGIELKLLITGFIALGVAIPYVILPLLPASVFQSLVDRFTDQRKLDPSKRSEWEKMSSEEHKKGIIEKLGLASILATMPMLLVTWFR